MFSDIIKGLGDYLKAISFIRQHRLLGSFLLYALIGIGLWGLIFWSVFSYSEILTEWIRSWIDWEWMSDRVINYAVRFVFILIFLFIFRYIYIIVLSPFMVPLAQKVRHIMLGDFHPEMVQSHFIKDFLRGLYLAMRSIWREIFFTVIVLLLSFIPIFSLFAPFVILMIQSYYAGFANLDYSLEGRYNLGERINLVKSNKGLAIGNGAIFLLIMIIPIFGAGLALPLATAAGAISMYQRS
ncbi:MAG TPA: EI24 domain-containing protein [Saprospiraceae bacterium]|nr:EI24 domain-containing protein [Saprospiraceae bacterium]HPK09780.1 EI24 domain-containing protein [Saprospiraceae bacterium]HPQ20744.1 EI24 domain-containing protein [Saprospiraceae bacterium]HRX28891.1 EI24 domain-containing protein [Saprospiraceae bacterium]